MNRLFICHVLYSSLMYTCSTSAMACFMPLSMSHSKPIMACVFSRNTSSAFQFAMCPDRSLCFGDQTRSTTVVSAAVHSPRLMWSAKRWPSLPMCSNEHLTLNYVQQLMKMRSVSRIDALYAASELAAPRPSYYHIVARLIFLL